MHTEPRLISKENLQKSSYNKNIYTYKAYLEYKITFEEIKQLL